jgi:hypothetical protein
MGSACPHFQSVHAPLFRPPFAKGGYQTANSGSLGGQAHYIKHGKSHSTGSTVPALAKNARTGHPLFRRVQTQKGWATRRSLAAHFDRLDEYRKAFLEAGKSVTRRAGEEEEDEEE